MSTWAASSPAAACRPWCCRPPSSPRPPGCCCSSPGRRPATDPAHPGCPACHQHPWRAGTGAAYVLNYRLITDEGPTATSTVTYLLPVVAVGARHRLPWRASSRAPAHRDRHRPGRHRPGAASHASTGVDAGSLDSESASREQAAWTAAAALVVGASFSHHAQGGGIWPDGAWHARPPAASTPPTNPAPEPSHGRRSDPERADFVGSVACPGGLAACHGVHRPRFQGQGRPPGQAFRRGHMPCPARRFTRLG
jgi:hypothetical protein